jgi:uncharacterized protein
MPHFVVYAKDKPGLDAIRAERRQSHRARLRKHEHPVIVRIGGPLLADDGRMIGTMLIVEAQNKTEVKQFMSDDPYVRANLYESLEIVSFQWGLTQVGN